MKLDPQEAPAPAPLATTPANQAAPGWTLPIAAAAVALFTRIWFLGRPNTFVFDEIYYAGDALDLLTFGTEGGQAVHPPFGKWLIAIGIQLGGYNPWSWRLAPLFAGVVVVLLTARLAQRICAATQLAALVAASAVIADGISVVTGRLALLDGLLALFTTAALFPLWTMAAQPHRRAEAERSKLTLGLVLGAALATKWAAAPLLLVSAIVALRLDLNWTPADSQRRAARRSLTCLVVVPALLYTAANVGYFFNYEQTDQFARNCEQGDCSTGFNTRLDGWWGSQIRTLTFHRTLTPSHKDTAHAWNWIAQTAPVELFEKKCTPAMSRTAASSDGLCANGSTERHRVLAVGNPLVWLAGSVAALAALARFVRTRNPTDGLLLAALASFWLPWLVGGRAAFSFYGAPMVPILGLLVARALCDGNPRWHRPAITLVLLWGAVAAVLWPVWTGAGLGSTWDNLIPYS